MISSEQIEKLANRKSVKKIAVENFLSSLGDLSYFEALSNLSLDRKMYKWNSPTCNAISRGIEINFKG